MLPMNKNETKTFIVIGAGNMASYLLSHQPPAFTCLGIYSRTAAKAALLSQQFGVPHLNSLSDIAATPVDYIFLAVSDTAIPSLLHSVATTALFISFSGMVDEQQLAVASNKSIASLWPLYSINNAIKRPTTTIPFVINREDKKHVKALHQLALFYTTQVIELSYEQRKAAHLAAVVLNNFVNHLYAVTQAFCEEHQIDPLILNPLVQQTAAQYETLNAAHMQTGPAIRGDQDSIQKHLEILQNSHLESIYTLLTESIKKSS